MLSIIMLSVVLQNVMKLSSVILSAALKSVV
jgi:hypothetical protein